MNAYGHFWSRVSERASGCLEWTGPVYRNGYGQAHLNGRHTAHRIAYEAAHGRVDDSLVIDHLCRNRLCVNVDHLEPVTQSENILRGALPALNVARSNVATCRKGRHPWTEENIHRNASTGKPQCRPCLDASYARANERKKAKRAADRKDTQP